MSRKQRRKKQRKQRQAKKIKQQNNSYKKRNYTIPVVAGTAAALTLAIAGWYAMGKGDESIPTQVDPSAETSPLEKIAYEEARKNPSLRQAYCNQVYENRAIHGDKAWDSFLSIEYDPGFKRLDAKRKELGSTMEAKSAYGSHPDSVTLANSIWLYGHGHKNHTWISEMAFKLCETQDEFFSLLDNEASSTYLREKGKMHFRLKQPKFEDIDNFYKTVEVISFDLQFSKILEGKRKVRRSHLMDYTTNAKELFSSLKQLAKSDHPDSQQAQAVIDAIRQRPTIQYFEETDSKSYADWWKLNVKTAKGPSFFHNTYPATFDLEKERITKIKTDLNNELAKRVQQKKLTITNKPVTLDIKTKYGYYGLITSQDTLARYVKNINEAVNEFYEYIGRKDLTPNVEVHLLKKDTPIAAPSKESAPMYVVWKRFEHVDARLHYVDDPENTILGRVEEIESTIRGELIGSYTGVYDKDKGISFKTDIHHIMLAVGHEGIATYAAPLSESVPLSVRSITTQKVNENVHDWWIGAGKPIAITLDGIKKIAKEWDAKEDSCVEALIDCFVETKLNQLGFTREEYNKYIKHGGYDQYRYAPAIRAKIKSLGAPAVFEMYLTNPDQLFE